jgi:enoyl-CoA hydratase/carnithine racemase
MPYNTILAEKDPHDARLVWIRLNCPERLNVLNLQMMQELYDALVAADRAKDVHAILLTGVGKAFSAGADVKELMEGDFEQGLRWLKAYWRIIELIRETGKPVLAAVKGACVAGGHEIALACDMAVAGESARLGQPEILVGSTAMGIGLQLLPLVVGERRARELLFTGRLVSAQEAHSFGLVNRVVEDAKLEEEARQLAIQILDNASPQAFRVMKSGLKFWTDFAMLNMMMSRDVTSMVWASPEFKDRSKDFLLKKKRKPRRFTGTMP